MAQAQNEVLVYGRVPNMLMCCFIVRVEGYQDGWLDEVKLLRHSFCRLLVICYSRRPSRLLMLTVDAV